MLERNWAIDGVRGIAWQIGAGLLGVGVLLVGLAGCVESAGELGETESAFEIGLSPDLALDTMEFEVTIAPELESVRPVLAPPKVTAYQVALSCAPIDLKSMMVQFNTYGTPEELAHSPGVMHVTQRGRHLFHYPDGAGEFVDLRFMGDDAAHIHPMPHAALLHAAEEMLDDMDALDVGPVTLARKGVYGRYREAGGSAGDHALLTHQVAVLEQRIDGRKAFGPGARVEVVFPGDDFAAEFSHGIRCLAADEIGVAQPPGDALRSFVNRVERGELWDLLGQQLDDVETLSLKRVRLGYYVPRIGEPATVVDPVYEITGMAKGWGAGTEPIVDEFLWYEPAIAGRPLPTTAPQD